MTEIFVFAFDLTESSQIRRLKSFRTLGYRVRSASFRRENMNTAFVPDWPNIDLGLMQNERYGRRMIGILRGIYRVMKRRDALSEADVIIARNFDLLIIAWITRWMTGQSHVPLVYECLDIHGLFTRPDAVGAAMRWCERRLLARVQLLLVSSPGFMRHYFEAIQGYQGQYAILENKLWFDEDPIPRPPMRRSRSSDTPLTIGWVGSIRCAPSLNLLMETADHFGDRVAIEIHGNIHRHTLPDFDEQIDRRDNVSYFGPYEYPDGLAEVYGRCDLVWAQDLWQRGANSDWLLPNRIYEASWFGCPSIAVAGTETGNKVARNSLGFVVEEPSAKALISLLDGLDRGAVRAMSDSILSMEDTEFRLVPDAIRVALQPALSASS